MSNLEVPQQTVIGPFRYEICFDAEASFEDDFFGQAVFRARRIKLDPRQSKTEMPQTVLHEVLHCLGEAYEIPAWERHTYDSDRKATDKIDLMATALLRWIRDNPKVVEWMQKDD
jgi:hypothetical protein